MARGRMISKSLSTSQKFAALVSIGELAEFTQLLYPFLVIHSDDFGRLQGDPFTVKHVCLPASPRSLEEFTAALTHLHNIDLIVWYEIGGKRYIQIENFDPHQLGLHKRTRSTFPRVPGNSGNGAESPGQEKGTKEKRTKGKYISQTLFVPKRDSCTYCGATAKQTGFALELDHFRPRSAGGTDDPKNRVWSCHPCNQAKANRVFETIEDCRRWLHEAFWASNRKRWIAHRAVAFGGKPPQSQRRTGLCPHEPRCDTRHACIERSLAEARAARKPQAHAS